MAQGGDAIDLAYPDSKTRRGRVGHGVSKTIETGGNMGVLEYRFYNQAKETAKNADDGDIVDAFNCRVNKTGISPTVTTRPEGFKTAILPVKQFRIRKLTPKECWRLMGFDDADFEKAKASGVSNSQLYKQAGNSIVVNVLEGILKNLVC